MIPVVFVIIPISLVVGIIGFGLPLFYYYFIKNLDKSDNDDGNIGVD